MPPLETTELNQTAIIWEGQTGYDDYGERLTTTPVEIPVRWSSERSQGVDSHGNLIAFDATAVVNQDIARDSLMYLGTLEDWYSLGSAGDETELMVVKVLNVIPDLKNRETFRSVGLVRFKDQPG